jgi:hypothetical protein
MEAELGDKSQSQAGGASPGGAFGSVNLKRSLKITIRLDPPCLSNGGWQFAELADSVLHGCGFMW